MKSDQPKYHRRSIRLIGFDYSQAASYFVTLVSYQRAELFGEVICGEVRLNAIGKIIEMAWLALEERFPTVVLDELIIMPNHIHAIISIVGAPLVGAQMESPVDANTIANNSFVGAPLVDAQMDGIISRAGTSPAPTIVNLGEIIGAFKSIVTHECILAVRREDLPRFAGKIWQRNYYEHIVCNVEECERIGEYIWANPMQWAEDPENPASKQMVADSSNELTLIPNSGNSPNRNEDIK